MRLPGATVEQLAQWLPLAWSRAKTLTANDPGSPDFTHADLDGSVRLDERWLSVWFEGHVGSFLHQLARFAADMGQPALVEEREAFSGEAPFLAMTAYLPGKPAELRFFDPLRPETARRPIPEAWLSRFCGYGGTVEQFALEEPHPRGQLLKLFPLMMSGRLVPQPQLRSPEEHYVLPRRQDLEGGVPVKAKELTRAPLPESIAEGLSFASAVLTLLLVAPIALGVPVLAASLIKPSDLETWAATIGGSWFLCGWLAFLPLKWPSGGAIALPVRLAWFVGLPALISLAWGLS